MLRHDIHSGLPIHSNIWIKIACLVLKIVCGLISGCLTRPGPLPVIYHCFFYFFLSLSLHTVLPSVKARPSSVHLLPSIFKSQLETVFSKQKCLTLMCQFNCHCRNSCKNKGLHCSHCSDPFLITDVPCPSQWLPTIS